MGAVTSKVRLYDLAKELKIDTKRLIEDVRREGVDVSVPSNSISKELAERIREKYFPKKDVALKRAVKVVKKAARPVVEEAPLPVEEEAVEAIDIPELEPIVIQEPEPVPPAPSQVVRRLAPFHHDEGCQRAGAQSERCCHGRVAPAPDRGLDQAENHAGQP